MPRSAAFAASLAYAAGCAELIDLAFDQCGNGLVEPLLGEKCDTAVDDGLGEGLVCGPPNVPAQACRYVCGAAGGACPRGWSCGPNDVCIHAIGRFEPSFRGALGTDAIHLGSGDFDGDRHQDLLVSNGGTFTIEFNSGTGTFLDALDVPVAHNFEPAVADLDGDGIDDITLSLAGPLILLGQSDRQPLPAAIANSLDEFWGVSGGSWAQLHVEAGHFLALMRIPDGLVVQRGSPDRDMVPLPAEAAATGELLSLGTVSGTAAFALAFRGMDELLILEDPGVGVRARIPMPRPLLGGLHLFGGDLLVQIEAGDDPYADAVARVRLDGSFDVELDRSFEAFLCATDPFNPQVPPDCLADRPRELHVFPLATGDFGFDPRMGVVTPLGVFERPIPGQDLWLRTGRSFDGDVWLEARTGDLNRDGALDLVAVTTFAQRLDVLIGLGDASFVDVPIVTRERPANLMVGDFDRDLQDEDIAFVERGTERDKLTVLYYDPPAFTARRFPVLGRIDSAAVVRGVGGVDVTMVLAPDPPAGHGFAYLGSNTYRLMTNFVQPAAVRDGFDVVYVGTPTFDDAGPSVVVAYQNHPGPGEPPRGAIFEWRFLTERLVAYPVELGEQCPRATAGCIDIVTVALDRDLRRQVVLSAEPDRCDGGPSPVVLRTARRDADGPLACTAREIDPIDSTAFRSFNRITTADLDGEGPLDLLLLTSTELRIYWNYSEGEAVSSIPMQGDDLVVLNADADAAPEVMVIGDGTAELFDVDGRVIDLVESYPLEPRPEAFRSARAVADDFTGDGIADVTVADGRSITVYRMLTSGDRR
jgi:hypothetical protein